MCVRYDFCCFWFHICRVCALYKFKNSSNKLQNKPLKKKTKNSSNTYATVYSEKPCWFSNPYSKLMFAKTQCECKKRRIVLMTAKHSATVYSCDRPQQFIEIRKNVTKHWGRQIVFRNVADGTLVLKLPNYGLMTD